MAMARAVPAFVIAFAGGQLIVSLGGIHWQPPLAGLAFAPFGLVSALLMAPAILRFSADRKRRRAAR